MIITVWVMVAMHTLSAVAATVTLIAASWPLLLDRVAALVMARLRDQQRLVLHRRRRELAEDAPTVILTSFVRSRRAEPGTGMMLLSLLKIQWRAGGTVVIGDAGNDSLITLYLRQGAVREQGTAHRMRLDCRITPTPS